MANRIRSRWTLIAISLVILLVALACSEEATPTPTPDTGAAVQQAIQQALADRPSEPPRAILGRHRHIGAVGGGGQRAGRRLP